MPVRVKVPDLGADIIVLQAAVYDEIREILEDERERKAIAQVALKSAARWAQRYFWQPSSVVLMP